MSLIETSNEYRLVQMKCFAQADSLADGWLPDIQRVGNQRLSPAILFHPAGTIAARFDRAYAAVLPIRVRQIRLSPVVVYETSKFPVFYEVP